MESTTFTNRLQKLLEYYDLSASHFATKIGVQRSSISHILSGRNKPSLDFVMKVLHTFNDVSIEWLIDGKGTFPKSNTSTTSTENINLKNESLETKEDILPHKPAQIEISKINTATTDKKIEKIILLYSDGSFESFKN